VNSDIILTDEVYEGGVPAGLENVWYHYTVTDYNGPSKTFTVKYQMKMIHKDGDEWQQDNKGRRETIPNIALETVDKGIKLYNKKFADVKDRQLKEDALKKDLLKKKAGDDDNGKENMDDLDAAAESSKKRWYGEEVIEVEFERTGNEGYVQIIILIYAVKIIIVALIIFACGHKCSVTDGGLKTREWRHKKIKDFTFPQSMNVGNNTWHSGLWKRKLETVATSLKKPFVDHPNSQKRAQYILDMRANKTKTPQPSSGMGFFPFEEQLVHHANEARALASSGIGASFFQNPFVRDYLQ